MPSQPQGFSEGSETTQCEGSETKERDTELFDLDLLDFNTFDSLKNLRKGIDRKEGRKEGLKKNNAHDKGGKRGRQSSGKLSFFLSLSFLCHYGSYTCTLYTISLYLACL